MLDLSGCVRAIRFTHGESTLVNLLLTFEGVKDPKFIVLVGVPSPGLAERDLTLERQDALAETPVEICKLGDRGVLVEATVRTAGGNNCVRLVWHDADGERLVNLKGCTVEVHGGPPIEQDDEDEIEYKESVVSGFREWLGDWTPKFDRSKPPLTFEEIMDGTGVEMVPVADLIGRINYAPVTHMPGEQLEIVTLGELLKLHRLHVQIHCCEHMRIPHLYVWLTRHFIPTEMIPSRAPRAGSYASYLTSDDCGDCAIQAAEEYEGINL